MEWLIQLQGQVVGLDSAPLIYFIEQNPNYVEMMRFFFRLDFGQKKSYFAVAKREVIIINNEELG